MIQLLYFYDHVYIVSTGSGCSEAISVSEAQCAASRTDGKISLSSLDPGAPQSLLKMCWELFIAGLVLYFVAAGPSFGLLGSG